MPKKEPQRPTTPNELKREFIKTLESFSRHRGLCDHFNDFLEMAYCAVAKQTLPPGEGADKLEARYMAVVKRHDVEDVRYKMPKLMGLMQISMAEGGMDFLGEVSGEMEILNARMGQFFTPYDVSRMMAEMQLQDAGEMLARQSFLTLSEPAWGAGCMVIAAAAVLTGQGHDIGTALYVEANDVSDAGFKMAYLQLSARGVPATVRRMNTLTLELFESAQTPAFFPFFEANAAAFKAWHDGSAAAENTEQPALATGGYDLAEKIAPRPPHAKTKQLSLF